MRRLKNRRDLPLVLLLLLLLAGSVGCVSRPRDITADPDVQSRRIVGVCLLLKEDASVYRLGRPFPRLVIDLAPSRPEQGGPAKHVRDLAAGTRLRVAKVYDAVTYYDGLFSAQQKVTFARVESGPEAGRLVDLDWKLLPSSVAEVESIHGRYACCPDSP